MKSKRLRNTTRSRNVKKTKRRSRRRRRQRTKRGGMHRAVSALRSTLGTMWYHNLASSIEQYRNYLLTTKAPLPSDGVMVNYGEKYRTLLEGVEIDDGVKESIRNFKKELEDPVKVADKFKALAEMYNKLISKLEEERKREIERARQQALARGNTSSFTGQRLASLLPSSQRTPSSPSPSASASVLANTPPTLRMPLTTIQSPPPVNSLTSPQKVRRTKLGLSRNIGGDDGGDDGDGSQINQQLFPHDENSTPPPSPTRTRSPAVVAPKSKNNNTAPFSPMRPLPPLIKHSSIYTVEYLNPHSGYKLQQRYQ